MTIDYSAGASLTDSVTACQTALTTLQSLGRSADADTLLTETEQTTPYAGIDADTTRNDEWKITQYAKQYSSVMASLATKLTAAANIASTQYQDDAEHVFGVKGLQGDPGVLIVNLRDAQDRIEDEYDSIKLQRLLDKAVLNGDDVRAHAIVESAVMHRDEVVTTAFQSAYPDLADAVARLWNTATHGTTAADVVMSWRLGALKPAAIRSLQNYEIAAAAAGQTSAGSWNVSS